MFHPHDVKSPFQLDCIFRPRKWSTTVKVPEPEALRNLSCHLPVILDVD